MIGRGVAILVMGNFSFAWVLAFYLAGWRFIPGSARLGTVAFAVNSAVSVWVGFFAPVHLTKMVWEKHSWKLFGINGGHNLVATLAAAIILSFWR